MEMGDDDYCFRVGNHHRMGSVQSSEKSGEGQGQKSHSKNSECGEAATAGSLEITPPQVGPHMTSSPLQCSAQWADWVLQNAFEQS